MFECYHTSWSSFYASGVRFRFYVVHASGPGTAGHSSLSCSFSFSGSVLLILASLVPVVLVVCGQPLGAGGGGGGGKIQG